MKTFFNPPKEFDKKTAAKLKKILSKYAAASQFDLTDLTMEIFDYGLKCGVEDAEYENR